MQIFHVETVPDPKTGQLIEGKPRTIRIGPKTTKLVFAHCSNNHWVTIVIYINDRERFFVSAEWYCSIGQPHSKTTMDFYRKLIKRSLQPTAARLDEESDHWDITDEDCAKQAKGDLSNCGIFVLSNIRDLVRG